jgi:4a-hydroxytetrahydrobiopterin dehydratase
MSLVEEDCAAAAKAPVKLRADELRGLAQELDAAWHIVDGHHLERTWRFADFARALAFVNRAGLAADACNHHPNIDFTWGRATLRIFTHDVDGLSRADFILAAKIDRLPA